MASKKQLNKVWWKLMELRKELEMEKEVILRSRRTKKADDDLCVLSQKLRVIDEYATSYPNSYVDVNNFIAKEEKENRQPQCKRYNFRKRECVDYNMNNLSQSTVLNSRQETNCKNQQEHVNSRRLSCRVSGGELTLIDFEPRVMVTPMKKPAQYQPPVNITTPDVVCLGVLEKPKPELIDLASPIRH